MIKPRFGYFWNLPGDSDFWQDWVRIKFGNKAKEIFFIVLPFIPLCSILFVFVFTYPCFRERVVRAVYP